MTSLSRALLATGCALALLADGLPPAQASMVSGWWGGNWNCTIDGRPAKMRWVPVSSNESSCDGNACSTVSGARWKGSFSDNGSQAVPLTNARTGNQGGLFFNHADGNTWYLAKPTGNRTRGYTTWQGKRYPLACTH
jgi:hypothetical protein